MTAFLLKMVMAYLLGSISGSLSLGRLKKIDIRQYGSGNAGGTNAFRTQGLAFAAAVAIIDIGKGVLATGWIAQLDLYDVAPLQTAVPLPMACGFAAVLGHCYPLWHGFRGGKGAATAVGALIIIAPWLLIPVALTWLVVLTATGYVGLATVLAGFSLVPAAWLTQNPAVLVFAVIIALFLLFTHRSNMRNLRNGTELRFERARLFSHKP